MFGRSFFGAAYFGPVYWGQGSGTPPVIVTRSPYYSEFSAYRIPDSDPFEYVQFKLRNKLNTQDAEDVMFIMTSIVDKLDG
jgi:hypothetical protein